MTYGIWAYIAVMAGVTYLVRMLPLTLFRKKLNNRFLRSFLFYVPYAVLTVMTVPAVFREYRERILRLCGICGRARARLPRRTAAAGGHRRLRCGFRGGLAPRPVLIFS